jgi:hypothetical protein
MPIVLNGTDGITQADQFNSDSTFGFKNRIINGNMAIAQRTTSAVTTDEAFPVDRFQLQIVNANLSLVQSSTAPAGFNYSIAATVTSTTSATVLDRSRLFQNIEGFNVADLGFGTANAKTITVSFWARSTVTGTYSGNVSNYGGNRSYIFTYALTANTWTYVTATIPGDTTGTWLKTNSGGMVLNPITFNCGANYQGTDGIWIAGDARGTSSSTYLATSNSGAVFNITGVQLEVGSTATSFDYRPYGTEFSLCERYFQKYSGNTTGNSSDGGFVAICLFQATAGYTGFTFPQMRTGPSLAYSSLNDFTLISDSVARSPLTNFVSNGSSNNKMEININWSSNLTAGFSAWLRINTPSGFYSLSAEL